MKTISAFLTLVFISTFQSSGHKVYVTNDKYAADLVVYVTKDKNQATNSECVWYIADSKYAAQFTYKLAHNKYDADLVIYYTNSKYEAGWKKNHPLRGHLND